MSYIEKVQPIFILFLLFAGCYGNVQYIAFEHKTYPKTNEVEVLVTKPIEKDYIELGELRIQTRAKGAIESLINYAMNIGANGLIIIAEESDNGVILHVGDLYTTVNRMYIKAIAIKYK